MINYYAESKVKEAWKLYTTKGMLRREVLRSEVAYSWARCQFLGLSANKLKDTPISPEEYHLARNDSRVLLQNATAFIENFIAVSGFNQLNMALTDSRGIVLVDWIHDFESYAYRQGVSVLEEKLGTNGAALSISQKKPFVVSGSEHYCEDLQSIQSIGVPLYDNEKKLIAILAGTIGLNEEPGELLEKLEHLGSLIIGSLQKFSTHQMVTQLKDHYAAALDALPEAVLCFDRYGQILHGNKMAEELFKHKILEIKQFNIRELIRMDQPIRLESIISGDTQNKMLEGYFESSEGYQPAVIETVSFVEEGSVKMGMIKMIPFDIFRHRLNQWAGNKSSYHIKDIVGRSHYTLELKRTIRTIAISDFACTIIGEKGTGKKVIAHAIHSESKRHEEAFYYINCMSVPKREIEAVLFGAVDDGNHENDYGRMGVFELADKGAVYLDNVCDLPLNVQGKLVKYLDTQAFCKLGSEYLRKTDVRVICSCHFDPMLALQKGTLRQELYNRMIYYKIDTVPLRQRKEDLAMLVEYLLDELIHSYPAKKVKLDESFYKCILEHDWPGNISELQKKLQAIVYRLQEGDSVTEDHFYKLVEESMVSSRSEKTLNLEELEKDAILKAIELTGENLTQTSKVLGIGRSTLYRKMEKYGIRLTHNETLFTGESS